jgi:thymidylate synthase
MTEASYLKIMRQILDEGIGVENDRTGVGTRGIFGAQMVFDMDDGFPLLTTRRIAFRIAFEEMMWFLRGQTDSKILEQKKINIWKGNTTREFLDAKGLVHLPEGDAGKNYSWQLRNFNGSGPGLGYDQLAAIVSGIKTDPSSRRHFVSYWNPQQVLTEAALPPCHVSWAVQIAGGRLNLSFQMRSNDFYLGNPTNIAGYGFLLHALANLTGYRPGRLVFQGSDVHLYNNQLDNARIQVTREPLPLPEFRINKQLSDLDDLLALEYLDVEVVGYKHHPELPKVEMAV